MGLHIFFVWIHLIRFRHEPVLFEKDPGRHFAQYEDPCWSEKEPGMHMMQLSLV